MSLWDDDEEFTAIPVGCYEAVLDESKLDMSKSPMVVTTIWKVINNTEFAGRKLWLRLTFGESAMKFVKWQTGVLGIGSELKECASWEASAEKCHEMLYEEMNSMMVAVEVTHREYNGKTYENMILTEMLGKYTESAVHPGVENMAPGPAPTFDKDEEIPF